jgi:uncharacterized protein
MNRDEVLAILRRHKPVLERRYGVRRIGVFGSVARDEATGHSDVDVVVEMPPDLYRMVHIKELLEEALDAPVDLVRKREHMNALLRERIDNEAVYA